MSDLVDAPPAATPSTLRVVVRSRHHLLELAVSGPLDGRTAASLPRDLATAFEPCHTDVHLDLSGVDALGRAAVDALATCRAFARGRGVRLLITPPSPELRQGGEGLPSLA
jgi:anti-anti-sigma regulatory factor